MSAKRKSEDAPDPLAAMREATAEASAPAPKGLGMVLVTYLENPNARRVEVEAEVIARHGDALSVVLSRPGPPFGRKLGLDGVMPPSKEYPARLPTWRPLPRP